ncbi:MAG: SEC-C domain-containing protein [Bacteroidales bacterium]|nr:SEC-C domain-containing protein [Bacteroidales bacterium]
MKIRALTHNNYIGTANCIKTEVHITNAFTNRTIDTLGIWDTGATNSVITKSVAQSLGLIAVSKANVRGVHGTREVNVYYVNITLNNKDISINTQVTECDELSGDKSVGMLIGMNIITMGDFAITNYQGKTTMSFRVPSMQRIDFVAGMQSGQTIVKDRIPNRNDSCPCGSGKKYKNCCGK